MNRIWSALLCCIASFPFLEEITVQKTWAATVPQCQNVTSALTPPYIQTTGTFRALLFGAVNTLIFCRRILNVLFQKVIPDNMRLALTFVHVTSNIADHFFQGSGTSSPQSIALDILVDQFVRI